MLQELIAHQRDYHILLVDDDPALLTGMSDLLEMAGYRISPATDGRDALSRLEAMDGLPDLIVSDIRMPNMDGYALLDAIREHHEWISIPFIFLTAKGEKEDIRDGKLRGVEDYLTKPFEFPDLLVSIQSCLSRREQLDAARETQMESLRRRILTTLNHEFRTPLSLIVAYADLMANSATFEHSAELRQYINGILDGSERLSRLVESFLILAEFESGYAQKLFNRRKDLIDDMKAMVEGIVQSLSVRANKRGVQLHIHSEQPLPTILGEVSYCELAIRHLVDNAIKFSSDNTGAVVDINLREQGSFLVVEVIDQGVGIPEQEKMLLFEVFHQINREKYEQQGTGTGLRIVRHVADLHGGTIEVESEPGGGSTFRLKIPAYRPLSDAV